MHLSQFNGGSRARPASLLPVSYAFCHGDLFLGRWRLLSIPVPVDVAKAMGAEIWIIAVNSQLALTAPKLEQEAPKSKITGGCRQSEQSTREGSQGESVPNGKRECLKMRSSHF